MQNRTFGLIFDRQIKPKVDEIVQGSYFIKCNYNNNLKDLIFEGYKKGREDFRKLIRNEGIKIDRHKIAALFVRSVLQVEAFTTIPRTIDGKQAKQLQQEAKSDLEKAKKEVEAMILGEK